ncbi:MAG: biopolymer transporter ExbD [Paracoccaceae bacterium]|nr:biopolymer transporter ExbD [Paracoccaceae bacterium]
MLNLAADTPRRRRPSLTPMIDVVFLLLVFFMLAARFGLPEALPLTLAGTGAEYTGPPRLITVLPESVLLNGAPVPDLAAALAPLMSDPSDIVVLRAGDGTNIERLAQVLAGLRAEGFSALTVVE